MPYSAILRLAMAFDVEDVFTVNVCGGVVFALDSYGDGVCVCVG